MEKLPICEKGEKCECFLIRNLVTELGGLGNEEKMGKIKSPEEFRTCSRKLKKVGRWSQELDQEVTRGIAEKGICPCADPAQILVGRRKYQAGLKKLSEISWQIRKSVKREKEIKKYKEVIYNEEGIQESQTF